MTQEQREAALNCFLFRELSPVQAEDCCNRMELATFPPGEVIYSPGSFRPALALVLSGQITVVNGDGVTLNRMGPGECFGAAAVFAPEGEEYVTVVSAVTRVTLGYLTRELLADLFSQSPQTAISYLSFLSRKIYFLNRKIDSFTAGTAREAVLLWLNRQQQDGQVEVKSYTKLAGELNLGRASLYRALESLERSGRISRCHRTITLHNTR